MCSGFMKSLYLFSKLTLKPLVQLRQTHKTLVELLAVISFQQLLFSNLRPHFSETLSLVWVEYMTALGL